ncbi:hypothetical protein N7491_000247 [Penicillium cf. griseofulvum]|uniref:Uncharacterized protein n=1 Tax=Penicillium cf. griseofulvum TaxID=2972120 RepID=A0A9W9MEN4_9EURO|nr:hypothetical protein N7472_004397 [Penicillium cf. griseofulvum]KAJ5441957.1 hypothetical protein N7445_004964 [Penicillium cf. griseofulvum]KAJ5451065.1 hypothetical protein N7491_000247 [Penicillium cf. griseofulvum]
MAVGRKSGLVPGFIPSGVPTQCQPSMCKHCLPTLIIISHMKTIFPRAERKGSPSVPLVTSKPPQPATN